MLRTLLTVSLCVGAALLGSDPVHAQAYPNRPIKIIVPFPAGGPTDGMARIISDRLGTVLGQSIIIENRGGGAGGSVGAKVVASADPDGYTILLTPGGSLTTGPAVHKNLGYDPLKAFVPVGLVMETPQVVSVHPDLPVVPTTVEAGYPKLVSPFWLGVVAPAGTPPAIVTKLNTAFRETLAAPETRDRLANFGAEAKIGTPEAFGKLIADELALWQRVVRDANITVE